MTNITHSLCIFLYLSKINKAMSNRLELEIQFYESLAKLFYTLMLCDNSLHKNEVKKLSDALHGNFIAADDSNVFKTAEGIKLIEKKLGELIIANPDVWTCLDEFKAFKKEHEQFFSTEIKTKLWKVLNSLAYTVAGKNKAEVIALNEISMIFNKP